MDLVGYCDKEGLWKEFTATKEELSKGYFRCDCGELFSMKIGEQVTSKRTFNSVKRKKKKR